MKVLNLVDENIIAEIFIFLNQSWIICKKLMAIESAKLIDIYQSSKFAYVKGRDIEGCLEPRA